MGCGLRVAGSVCCVCCGRVWRSTLLRDWNLFLCGSSYLFSFRNPDAPSTVVSFLSFSTNQLSLVATPPRNPSRPRCLPFAVSIDNPPFAAIASSACVRLPPWLLVSLPPSFLPPLSPTALAHRLEKSARDTLAQPPSHDRPTLTRSRQSLRVRRQSRPPRPGIWSNLQA